MQLAKKQIETASKNYGTNEPNSQETTTARSPNAIYRMLYVFYPPEITSGGYFVISRSSIFRIY